MGSPILARRPRGGSVPAEVAGAGRHTFANLTPTRHVSAQGGAAVETLVIDIGGTGTKMLRLDPDGNPVTERHRELTPDPSTPDALLELIARMVPDQARQ